MANTNGNTWHITNTVTKPTIKNKPLSCTSNLRIPITYCQIAPTAIPIKQSGIL